MATCTPLSPADLNGGLAAMAAYAKDLVPGMQDSDLPGYVKALKEAGFTNQEAIDFASQNDIVYADEYWNGAGVAVFQDNVTGEVTIAIDGTDPTKPFSSPNEAIGDLLTDLRLTSDGIVDPNSYPQFQSIKQFYEVLRNTGPLANGGIDNTTVNVVGHSSGGFLAVLLQKEFPNDFSAVTTYNAPGLGGLAADLASQLPTDVVGWYNDYLHANTDNVRRIRNSQDDIISTLGEGVGQEIVVYSQPSNPLEAHSLRGLVNDINEQVSHPYLGDISAMKVRYEKIVDVLGSEPAPAEIGELMMGSTVPVDVYQFTGLNVDGFSPDLFSGVPGSAMLISGVPDGAQLEGGSDIGSGRWLVPTANSDGLTIAVPHGYSGALNLTARVDDVTSNGAGLPPVVNAKTFAVNVSDVAVGGAQSVALDPALAQKDILVSNVPTGVRLNVGMDNGDGTWSVQAEDVSRLVAITPPKFTGELNLEISATEADGATGTFISAGLNSLFPRSTSPAPGLSEPPSGSGSGGGMCPLPPEEPPQPPNRPSSPNPNPGPNPSPSDPYSSPYGSPFSDPSDWRDPLVLDLDGDGVELITQTVSNAYFDFDQDGFAEKSGWVSGDDGMLVVDRNGDGQINDISELVGSGFVSPSTSLNPQNDGPTGFADLATYDSNGDGVVNSADSAWADLLVWRDLDGDGVADDGELQSLDASGVASIDLAHTNMVADPQNALDFGATGNVITQQGSFTKADGTTGAVADAWLTYSPSDTVYLGSVQVGWDMIPLPYLTGMGEVKNSYYAMTEDPLLKEMGWDIRTTSFTDAGELASKVEAFILRWAGVDGVDAQSRGQYTNGAYLGAMEKFMGHEFRQLGVHANPYPWAGSVMMGNFKQLQASVMRQILPQIPLGQELMPELSPGYASQATLDATATLAPMLARMEANAPADAGEAVAGNNWLGFLPGFMVGQASQGGAHGAQL